MVGEKEEMVVTDEMGKGEGFEYVISATGRRDGKAPFNSKTEDFFGREFGKGGLVRILASKQVRPINRESGGGE